MKTEVLPCQIKSDAGKNSTFEVGRGLIPSGVTLSANMGTDANGKMQYAPPLEVAYGSGLETAKMLVSLDYYSKADHPISVTAVFGVGMIFYLNGAGTEITGVGFAAGFGANFLGRLGFGRGVDASVGYNQDVKI